MFNLLKMVEMLAQANQMQEEIQRKLNQTIVEGTSGGGAVTATMNGKKQLLKIHIDPSAVTSLSRQPSRRGDARRPDRSRRQRRFYRKAEEAFAGPVERNVRRPRLPRHELRRRVVTFKFCLL